MDRRVWLAAGLTALVGSTLWLNRDWPFAWQINQRGVRVNAWVIGKGDAASRVVHYAYQGPLKVHTASGRAGSGTPPYDALKEGDSLTVYILPERPDASLLGTPDERLLRQHTILVWTLIAAGALLAWTFRRELRRQAS